MKKKSLFASFFTLSFALVTASCNSKSQEHAYIYVEEAPATCTVDGVEEHYACEDCPLLFDMDKNEVTLDDLVIPAHHTMISVNSKEETCTEDGYYAYYHCEMCNKNFADEDGEVEIDLKDITLPKKGHHFHFHEAVEATCTEDGSLAYYECDQCHKYYSDENGENELSISDVRLEALGHDMVHHEAVESTCVTDGSEEYYECQRCYRFYSDAEGKNRIEEDSWIIEGHHEMEHVEALDPTFDEDGNIEHYHCDKCDKNFEDEAGEVEITASVILPALPKHLDFESDRSLTMIANGADTTVEISDEQHNSGSKSLKVTLTSGANALVISDEYYDMLPEEGLVFAMYCGDIFNGDIPFGEPIYNAGHGSKESIHYWQDDRNAWREYHIAKSSINPEEGNHWVFTVGANTTVYLDDIRPFTKFATFENAFDRLSIVDDYRTNVSLSSDYAISGNTSLKVEIPTNESLKLFLLSDVFYNYLPEEGITFSILCEEAFNFGVYGLDDHHYWSPVGVWKQYTIAKDHINPTPGDHWVCLPRAVVTVYLDDIFFADIVNDATGTGFEEPYSLLIAKGDERNRDVSISQDYAFEGHNSLKVVNSEAYFKGLIISDTFYNKLPEEGGITFYLYAEEKKFNCYSYPVSDETLIPYYPPLSEWKKVTVAKDHINPNAGDHWVFLIGDVTTVYIDNISIVASA